MKLSIFSLFSLLLLSSCATLSSDDQLVNLSSDTNQEAVIVEVYNREKGVNDIVTINVDNSVHQNISINPQQVVSILLDGVEGKKTDAVLSFGLPTGKTIEKNIDVKLKKKVFIAIENNEVVELSDEEWYSKLNKDRDLNPAEKVLVLVFSPILVPVALASLMVVTLVAGIAELWQQKEQNGMEGLRNEQSLELVNN